MTAVRQRNVALILARELAVNVATPMWIWDENGELVYYNEHVQKILGSPPEKVGIGRLEELPQLAPTDLDGNPLPVSEIPSAIVLQQHVPAHRDLGMVGFDGVKRILSVTSFPLFARGGEFLGAVSVFWEKKDENASDGKDG
jgi:PAS domain-containing protein